MIRLLTAGLLLLTSSALLAQPLYRWIEADGSITFSPNKPTGGQEYELVQPNGSANNGTIVPGSDNATAASQDGKLIAAPKNRAQALAISEAGLSPVSPGNQKSLSNEEIVARSQRKKPLVQVAPSQGLAYAPRTANQDGSLPNGITPGAQGAVTAAAPQDVDATGKHAVVPSSRKVEQCKELRKRVVSLERQIKTGLTPDQMDSTVVYMARYQRSINQHCD